MAGGINRRQFLLSGSSVVGVSTLASALAACSSQESIRPPDVVPLFSADRVIAAGIQQRIPFAVVDNDNVAGLRDDDELAVTITDSNDKTIAEVSTTGRVVEHDHPEGNDPDHQHTRLFRYYPLRTTLPEPGVYNFIIKLQPVDGQKVEPAVLPVQAFDADEVKILLPGQQLPELTTPTTQDSAGVDTLCTRFEGICPFHEKTVTELLAENRPLAVLVATPALCSTAYCGPVLNLLVEASANYPDIAMVHLEPYANPAEVNNNFADPAIRLAPAAEELGLDFEPSLFLVDSTGKLVERIDNVFDGSELAATLDTLR